MKSWKHKLLFTVRYSPVKHKAFTLAEVLITLGIIGVVATMTITVLVPKVQDMQFKEAAKEAFSKASQAVQQMKVDNGGDLNYYYNTQWSFKPIFIKYFKYIKDCNNLDCVPYSDASNPTGNIYKSLHGEIPTWIMVYGQFVTADGMFWSIYNNSSNGYICIAVDVNGYKNGPNIYGRDMFMFQILNNNLVPMGSSGTWYANQDSGNYYCNKAYSNISQDLGCMQYVMQGVDY